MVLFLAYFDNETNVSRLTLAPCYSLAIVVNLLFQPFSILCMASKLILQHQFRCIKRDRNNRSFGMSSCLQQEPVIAVSCISVIDAINR